MLETLAEKKYIVKCMDGAEGMLLLPDSSIKLVYGSPPYPNAERNYGVWKSDEYISKISPFINAAKLKLREDGFIVINVKANRERHKGGRCTTRSLVVEKLAIMMEEEWGLSCVDIEIWVKDNPVSTGLRVACQDAYEQNLWFSKSPSWKINLDAIRRPYSETTLSKYENNEFKPRANGVSYVRKNKRIQANPLGALPQNVIRGPVSARQDLHQAIQPSYLPNKYIKATTQEGDLVVDPWMGTGTTGIEALKLRRTFIGFDIYQEYVKNAETALLKTLEGLRDDEE
ncbi:DNA-methyltransferase [Cohnella laeviribosi]|uniref:DNA-methyltransferase n=1 Tax=Cohnella laeviribosi TaxID=380174 RepID=UPI00035C5728|nr:site-specific DNA-methyltransferase [Cohnella laeviribosi]